MSARESKDENEDHVVVHRANFRLMLKNLHINRMRPETFNQVNAFCLDFLQFYLRQSSIFAEHNRKRTLTLDHLQHAMESQGLTRKLEDFMELDEEDNISGINHIETVEEKEYVETFMKFSVSTTHSQGTSKEPAKNASTLSILLHYDHPRNASKQKIS